MFLVAVVAESLVGFMPLIGTVASWVKLPLSTGAGVVLARDVLAEDGVGGDLKGYEAVGDGSTTDAIPHAAGSVRGNGEAASEVVIAGEDFEASLDS